MKALIALITFAAAFNAQAFSKVETINCNGKGKSDNKPVVVTVVTDSANETLSYALTAPGKKVGKFDWVTLKISDVLPTATEYQVIGQRDDRRVDGALIKATLDIKLGAFTPNNQHFATLVVDKQPQFDPTVETFSISCGM